jgi:hypothetical protein
MLEADRADQVHCTANFTGICSSLLICAIKCASYEKSDHARPPACECVASAFNIRVHPRSSAVSFLPLFGTKNLAKQSQFPLCLQRRHAKTNPIKPKFLAFDV